MSNGSWYMKSHDIFRFIDEFSHASLSRQNSHKKGLKPESQGVLKQKMYYKQNWFGRFWRVLFSVGIYMYEAWSLSSLLKMLAVPLALQHHSSKSKSIKKTSKEKREQTFFVTETCNFLPLSRWYTCIYIYFMFTCSAISQKEK